MLSPAAVVVPLEPKMSHHDEGDDPLSVASPRSDLESIKARPGAVGSFCVLGVPFVSGGDCLTGGDFGIMIDQSRYQDTLFIFNGNVDDDWDENPLAGAGSAVIRPLCTVWEGCRCVGIPTGWASGTPFRELNGLAKMAIDMSVHRILDVIDVYGYARVLFSCAAYNSDRIGTQTFSLPEDVVEYISQRLIALPALARADHRLSTEHARFQVKTYLKEAIQANKNRQQKERISDARMRDLGQLTQVPSRAPLALSGLTRLKQTMIATNDVVGEKRPFSKPLVMTMRWPESGGKGGARYSL
jgi:hypothetical protein